MSPLSSYLLVLSLSMALSIAVGAYALLKSSSPVARWFGLVTFAEAFWSLGQAMELLSSGLDGKLFWDNAQWISTLGLPAALLGFALSYTGARLKRPRAAWGTIGAVSLTALALFFADGRLGLMRAGPRIETGGAFPELVYGFSPLHWAVNLWIFGVAAAGLAQFPLYIPRAPRLYRLQALVIFTGASFPYLAGLAVLLDLQYGPQRDALPLAFAALNLCIAWGLFRFRLFDVVPLARARIIERLTDPVAVFDGSGRLVDCNPALRALLGANADPLGHPSGELLPEWPGLADLDPGEFHETDLRWERGEDRPWFNARFIPLKDRRGLLLGRALVMRDITERTRSERELRGHHDRLEELVRERTADLVKANEQIRRELAERAKVEDQLRQSQKMEALGRLAGGVAHDLNNLLVPILAYTEMALAAEGLPDEVRPKLREVQKAGERAADLARQILAFSRRQVLNVAVLDLTALVKDSEKILRRLIGEDVEFKVVVPHVHPRVKADRTQIEQIVMNLIVNARDAMPGGGKLLLRIYEVPAAPAGFEFDPAAPATPAGPFAVIEVADNGSGMDEATRRLIFEPFFTTKPAGKGTGLGLSMVFGIVRQHHGGIQVESEPGRGSTFRIALPALAGGAAAAVPEAPGPAFDPADLRGEETVLVVDDEPIVRIIAVRILQAHGYHVLEASGAPEAFGLAALHEGRIDLLVTDIVMPRMNGRSLAIKLRSERPGLKVLFISGYSDAEMAERGLLDAGDGFLPKPFDGHGLAVKIREILGSRPEREPPEGVNGPQSGEGA